MRIDALKLAAETDAVDWQETGVPGVRLVPLFPDHVVSSGGGAREATVLIRMEPGHGYPAHRHLDVEEVLLLQGGYRDERGEHRAGDYVRYEAGSVHTPVALGDASAPAGADNPPCVLFAVARGGIERP